MPGVSGLWQRVDIFSMDGELEEPIIQLPNNNLNRYLAVYDDSLIYCTDMGYDGGPAIASIYKITKVKE